MLTVLLQLFFLVILMQPQPMNCTEAPTVNPFVLPTWQSGDVKLENGSSSLEGYVMLYLDLRDGTSAWGTVCNQVISSTTLDVICRQLGYFGAAHSSTATKAKWSVFSNNPVWLINDWSCKDNPNANHILQCVTQDQINKTPYKTPSSCTSGPLHIQCVETGPAIDNSLRLYRNPSYTNVPSFGAVQIYFTADPGWGYITAGTFTAFPFTMVAADTVCRQLGYTNAVTYGRNITALTPLDKPKTWFQGSNCSNSRVQSCFSCCYSPPLDYKPCGQLCDPSDVVFIQCTFDIGSIGVYQQHEWNCNSQSPGNDFCTPGLINALSIGLIVVLSVGLLLLLLVLGTIAAIYLYKKKQRAAAGHREGGAMENPPGNANNQDINNLNVVERQGLLEQQARPA